MFFLLSGHKVQFIALCGAKKSIFRPSNRKKSYAAREEHLFYSCDCCTFDPLVEKGIFLSKNKKYFQTSHISNSIGIILVRAERLPRWKSRCTYNSYNRRGIVLAKHRRSTVFQYWQTTGICVMSSIGSAPAKYRCSMLANNQLLSNAKLFYAFHC